MDKIVIFGCGGHAISVADSIKMNNEYEIAGFVDKEISDYSYCGAKVIGQDNDVEKLVVDGFKNGALGIGNVKGGDSIRKKVFENASNAGMRFPLVADRTAVVSETASIGEGTFVGKNSVINAETKIGKCCIINTTAVLEHEVTVGDFTHVSVGAIVCGGVTIGANCMIGAGAVIIQGVTIGDNATIGAGAVVISDVADGDTVVGNPAGTIKQKCSKNK